MKNLYKIEDELYIVDNTEEINKDTKICWCIDTSNNEVVLHQGVLPTYHYKYYKKIIMTTNTSINLLCGCGKNCGAKESGVQSIDDNFLKWFVQNSNCEEVKVENTCLELRVCDCAMNENCLKPGYKIIIPSKEVINPFELPNVLPDDVFNKSLEELAEKEYPKLIVENPSCNGYNEPNHIDINEECRNAFMEGVKSDEAKDYWFDIFKKNKEKWNKVTEDTPPSNVELLVKSPNGIIHLSRWRESYNIFGCQAKSESIVGWKWKKI